MKQLTTEQQVELQQLIEKIRLQDLVGIWGIETQAQLAYWVNELKPKRVRRVKLEPEGGNG